MELQKFKNLIYRGYYACKSGYELLTSEEEKNVELALFYINQANVFITNAYCAYDDLETDQPLGFLEDLFSEFYSFVDEVFDCVKTDHPHQWSMYHYDRLEKYFDTFRNSNN